MTRMNGDKALSFYVFVFFLSLYAMFSTGHFGGDGLENYLTAESIVLDRDLTIYDRPFDVKEMNYAQRGRLTASGERYSSYGLGLPLLIVPLYSIGLVASKLSNSVPAGYFTQFAVSFLNPVIMALSSAVLFRFIRVLGFNKKVSVLAVATVSLATMAPVYSRSGFTEPAMTLFMLLAAYFVHKNDESGSQAALAIAGTLTGYAILIKVSGVLFVPMVCAYFLYAGIWRKKGIPSALSKCAVFMAPVLAAIALYFLAESLKGSGVHEASAGKYNSIFKGQLGTLSLFAKGLYYNLFSSGKGYFFYNIPLILAVAPLCLATRKKESIYTFFAIFIFVNLIFYSFIFKRGSLFSWGPRYIYPTVPFMAIFLAGHIAGLRTLRDKALFYALFAAGTLVQVPAMFVNPAKYLFFVKERLGMPEYLINFMPDLSPIKGAWMLFISAIAGAFKTAPVTFTFAPDYVFIKPVSGAIGNYGVWDIWAVNILKVSPGLFPAVALMMAVLFGALIFSFVKIIGSISKEDTVHVH